MKNFVRKLITNWRKLGLPFFDETIVIAVSGGADSVSLALALHELKQRKKLNLNFVIAHFNHDLRGIESEKDAQFVQKLAENLDFQFETETGNISTTGNLEENARLARYEFLAKIAQKTNAYGVFTAHTINDQAETFLMNLIRGSGLLGLSAMKPIAEFQSKELRVESQALRFQIIRPLLNITKREETENFCQEKGFEFRKDEMNADEKFFRVRVRKKLIPFLQEFNPKIIETLAKTTSLITLELQPLNTEFISERLKINDLQKLDKALFYNVLRAWLKHHRSDLRNVDLKHIEAIERLTHSRKSGRIVELPNAETVYKKQGYLYYEKTRVEKS
jgi:tRNA(Ile)-lysidine synthase